MAKGVRMIYVIEGPDGTGKSTLAAAIAKKVNGQVLHLTYKQTPDSERYHIIFMQAAEDLDDIGIPVILDRWVPSERVYGNVFRNGERFNTDKVIKAYGNKVVWIYCRNDNAVENHLKNKSLRNEMFDDMTEIAKEFDQYIAESPLDWIIYDFDKVNINEFVKELPK